MNTLKIVAVVLPLILGASYSYAADTNTPPENNEQTAPAPATEPVKVSPELMRINAELGVLQGHMNALLTQRAALDDHIKALQQKIDDSTALRNKLTTK